MKRSRTAGRLAEVAPLVPHGQSSSIAHIGWIAGASVGGRPLVDFPGNRAGPLEAGSTVRATRRDLEAAAQRRQPVVLLFDGGDLGSPIVLGFIVQTAPEAEPPLLAEASLSAPPEAVQVDGKRICIEGQDEVVLRCGEASITLRRNGKLILRGTYLESSAKGTHRIRGGTVRVN